ncbi:MAG: SUMF1/EgtB/PvdO family nonheme iron enzyme, partial [Planctomycetes bacterium]|nr:SUMF1/EgtB/PvdO family nonheme iron enzyme [Planctomycetota bacterium]
GKNKAIQEGQAEEVIAALDEEIENEVDLEDARAYCGWRGRRDGLDVRLPTELEWEAACRGRAGRLFPWGDDWVEGAAQIDSSATAPVTAHPSGATPEGVLDLAGNVFEWTGSFMPDGRPALKGCSWDDAPGTCRCRPPDSASASPV